MAILAHSRYLDHIGFTVPNLDEAIDFFEKLLGAELVYKIGPFEFDDDWMRVNLNNHPRAVIDKMCLMALPTGTNLEIFQYSSPDQETAIPKNSDVGGHHFAFFVDDMEAARKNLIEAGIEVQGEVKTFDEGPCKGQSWMYFLAPWGLQLELVSAPPGWPYRNELEK